ncbi:GFA family protein [Ketobacter sp.]
MSELHSGSCLCGKTTFEVIGKFQHFYLCHCSRCRKDTGTAHAANLFSSTAELRWLSGKNNVKIFTLPETRHKKSFCVECGSALPNIQMDGKLLVVPAGCLDSRLSVIPDAHVCMASKGDWDAGLEQVTRLDELPLG